MRTFLPEHLISNFIDDQFDTPNDLVYYEVVDRANQCEVKDYIPYNEPKWFIGIDYGYGHKCGIVLCRHDEKINSPIIIEACHGATSMAITDIFNVIVKWSKEFEFKLNDLEVAVDPSAPLVIDELGRLGLHTIKASNKVDYGITIVNLLAKRGLLKIIRSNCEDLLSELLGFNKSRKAKKVSDDLVDALRYLIVTFFDWVGRSVSAEETNELLQKIFG
jgi:hypothetical protein